MLALKQAIEHRKVKALGKWTIEPSVYIDYWDYFFDITKQQLFHRMSFNSWETFPRNDTKTHTMTFNTTGIKCDPPPLSTSLCRCTISTSSCAVILESFHHQHTSTQNVVARIHSPKPINEIKSIITSFPDSKWAMKFFESTTHLNKLFDDFKKGVALFVGDGSYDDIKGIGAGACIAASADGTEYIIIGGPTPGPNESQNAYRSEVGTHVGMAILARSLSIATRTTPSITVSCDNDSALERPLLPRSQISSTQKSADLVSLAHHDLWMKSKLMVQLKHVKGHADTQNQTLTTLET